MQNNTSRLKRSAYQMLKTTRPLQLLGADRCLGEHRVENKREKNCLEYKEAAEYCLITAISYQQELKQYISFV